MLIQGGNGKAILMQNLSELQIIVGARQCRALQPIWHLNEKQYCFARCVLYWNDANSSAENSK
ncbi:MAG: hypothetical protein RMY34_28435 [Aulosira sp. DedQUE10]|nr:hypothetical protein [Aulosira sp. DedQUE10]